MDATQKSKVIDRLCPDMEALEEYYKVKNGYTNTTERISFSIEVHKCLVTKTQKSCKTDLEIEKLMS